MPDYPFPPIWIGGDLPGFRGCHSTYCRYDYRTLPPLPTYLFDGSFAWLRHNPRPSEYDPGFAKFWRQQSIDKWRKDAPATRAALICAAQERGVVIPDSFTTSIFDIDLVTMIRSTTDSYFSFPADFIRNGGPQGGHFLHFFSDSQNCYEWYLFLEPDGDHCVVASYEDLANPGDTESLWDNDRGQIVFCERSFESFIYRLWIENEIWFRVWQHDQPLTDDMQIYLDSSRNAEEDY